MKINRFTISVINDLIKNEQKFNIFDLESQMNIVHFLILSLLVYCDPFKNERQLVKRSKNYAKTVSSIVTTIKKASAVLCPMAIPLLSTLELMIDLFGNNIKALEFALKEYDSKKIKKNEFKQTAAKELKRLGGLSMSVSELSKTVFGKFVSSGTMKAKNLKAVADGCTIS